MTDDPSDADALDGHTIDELVDYLDAGREPRDPGIEGSPGCRIALDGLQRLRDAYRALLDADAPAATLQEEPAVARVLAAIDLEAHAGRDVPLRTADPAVTAVVTEGAIRGLVRAAGDTVGDLLIGRVRLHGDLASPDAPVVVDVRATAFEGAPIPAAVARLREAIGTAVARHTDLALAAVDVTVVDLQDRPADRGRPA